MGRRAKFRLVVAIVVTIAAQILFFGAANFADEPAITTGVAEFQTSVLPLLHAACLECHGSENPKGGLNLLGRAGMLQGGESGPALVPKSAATSLLIERIEAGEMPPEPRKKLTADQITMLRSWIDAGADAPEAITVEALRQQAFRHAQRTHWAFQPLSRPPRPGVSPDQSAATPIDKFILARLQASGLRFSPRAEPAALLRRLYFDLVGLPPTPAEVEEFLRDPSESAYARLVDRLLASPHFGERWGRHWLDGAGYVDVSSGDNDAAIIRLGENKWLYRDYVVASLNADKPFARFLTEQVAGDELVDWRVACEYTPEMREMLTATGFLRVSADDTGENELNTLDIRYGVLHRTAEILAGNLLGLTLQCAKCHDHKYEPITQRDYYRFEALLQPAFNPQAWVQPLQRQLAESPQAAEPTPPAAGQPAANLAPAVSHWQVVYDVGPPTPTWILRRGDPFNPGDEVPPGFLSVLSSATADEMPPGQAVGATSGRRLALARWLTDFQSPAGATVARVRVNRIWQHLFGSGLAPTADNFGVTGAAPTHPELLEWLACEFVAEDGRLKPLLREIVLSDVYCQTSAERQPAGMNIDPENRILWRQRLRRLEAEAIRDAMLAAGDRLDRGLGGAPVPVEPKPDGSFVVKQEGLTPPASPFRRSMYLLARRNYHPTVLAVFDQPHVATNCARRETSAVVLQPLTMLNDAFVLDQAAAIAEREQAEAGQSAEQIERAFLRILARRPQPEEAEWCLANLEQDALTAVKLDPALSPDAAAAQALARLCQTLLNTSEFLYIP